MDYNFVVDTAALDQLAIDVSDQIVLLKSLIDSLYQSFESLPSREIWGGPVYDAFMTGPDLSTKILKEQYIEPALKTLDNYVIILNAVSAAATDLVEGNYKGNAYGGGCGGSGMLGVAAGSSRPTVNLAR